MTMKRLMLVWVMIMCLIPMNVRGSAVMNDFHYEQYEKLYFKMIEQYPEPENTAFSEYPAAGRALFIVLIFDMEIQNGGLAQFFWNCGVIYAKLLPDALRFTGLSDVADLYESFIHDNDITLDVIASFRERAPGFVESYEWYDWYDYDTFDDAYMRIWEETDINQRFIDYSDHHPEIWDTP